MAGLGRRSHYRKHLTDSVLNDFPEPNPSKGERLARVVGTRGSNQFEIILSLMASSDSGPPPRRIPKLAILPTKFRKLVWVKRNDFVIVRCGDDDDHRSGVDRGAGGGEGDTLTTTESTAGQAGGTEDIFSGIRYEISSILYKEQVKHLKRKGLWPDDDPFFTVEGAGASSAGTHNEDTCADVTATVEGSHCAGASASSSSALSPKDDVQEVGEKRDKHDDGDVEEEVGIDDDDDGIVYDDDLLFVNTNKISSLRVDSDSDSESDSS